MSRHFQGAFDGLVLLVERLTSVDYSGEQWRQDILAWESNEARGSSRLAESAIAALEYELAERGVTGSKETEAELRTLQKLKALLMPEAGDLDVVEVNPAPEYRERFPGARAFRIGELQILATQDEEGWHVSASHSVRYPTWEELLAAARVAGGASTMWAHLPIEGGPEGVASFVVHLFEHPPEAL